MRFAIPFLCAAIAAAAPTALEERQTTNGRFTYFNLKTPLAAPCDLYTGPDGKIYASTFTADKLVVVNRASSNPTLTEITIPYTRSQLPTSVLPQRLQGAGACVVQPGADGNVYLATGIRNQLAQYNPRTGNFQFFSNTGGSAGNLQPFNDAWPASNGLWFTQTTANVLTFFSYSTHQMTSYTLPTVQSNPVGVYVVPSGDVWVCEFVGNKIAKFNIQTKTFTEYPVPLTLLGPTVVRAMTENRYLWFTALNANAIGRIDITTGQFKAYSNTLAGNLGVPLEDTVDGKGNIWFSTALSNTLNYITPSTGKFTRISQPDGTIITTPLSLPPAADIAIHWVKPDNAIWFTELANNRIGKYQLT